MGLAPDACDGQKRKGEDAKRDEFHGDDGSCDSGLSLYPKKEDELDAVHFEPTFVSTGQTFTDLPDKGFSNGPGNGFSGFRLSPK